MAFKSLVSAVSEQCHEIRQTLSSISYFSMWDANAIAECCRLSSLVEFPPETIILGSGTGNSHTVYFLLDGVCRMIHYLLVETKTDTRGETKYKLYKSVGETLSSELGSVGYASLLFNEKHEFQKVKLIEGTDGAGLKDELPVAGIEMTESNEDCERIKTEMGSKGIFDEDHHERILRQCRKKLQDIMWVNKEGATKDRPKNVNGCFVQTGFLFKGACFGLRKYTDKDFIMSDTKVKCLKIPQRFLLQHNTCNIWNRILLFDSLYQPKEEKILEYFRTDRKWMEGRKQLTESVVSQKKIPNYTGFSDVPYSIRLTVTR